MPRKSMTTVERIIGDGEEPKPKRNPIVHAESVFNTVMNQWYKRQQQRPEYEPRRLTVNRELWANMRQLFPAVCSERHLSQGEPEPATVAFTHWAASFNGIEVVLVRAEGWCLE